MKCVSGFPSPDCMNTWRFDGSRYHLLTVHKLLGLRQIQRPPNTLACQTFPTFATSMLWTFVRLALRMWQHPCLWMQLYHNSVASPCPHVPTSPSIHPSIHPSISMVFIHLYPSIRPSIHHLSLHPSIHPSISPSFMHPLHSIMRPDAPNLHRQLPVTPQ